MVVDNIFSFGVPPIHSSIPVPLYLSFIYLLIYLHVHMYVYISVTCNSFIYPSIIYSFIHPLISHNLFIYFSDISSQYKDKITQVISFIKVYLHIKHISVCLHVNVCTYKYLYYNYYFIIITVYICIV